MTVSQRPGGVLLPSGIATSRLRPECVRRTRMNTGTPAASTGSHGPASPIAGHADWPVSVATLSARQQVRRLDKLRLLAAIAAPGLIGQQAAGAQNGHCVEHMQAARGPRNCQHRLEQGEREKGQRPPPWAGPSPLPSPPVFDSYATVVLPYGGEAQDQPDRAVLGLLREQSARQPWWLGYLDTGADDIYPTPGRT